MPVNRIFFLLTITIALWLTALLIGDLTISYGISLTAVRVASILGILIAPLILYLSNAFPVQLNKPSLLFRAFAILPTTLFIVWSFFSPFVPRVTLTQYSAQPAGLGLDYTIASAYVVISFIFTLIILLKKRKQLSSRERSQISLVVAGLVVTVLINVFTGLILTVLNQANNYSNLAGALSFLVLIGTTAYAIVKYRLFDIRLAITRVIGYSITIGVVASIYSLIILVISTQLTALGTLGLKELVILLAPTIFVALTFSHVERFIARHTQQVFYRDAYNEREVLDKLSDALITENDVTKIMQQSLNVLVGALRPSSAYLAVLNTSGAIYHQASINNAQPKNIDTLLLTLVREKRLLVDRHEGPNAVVAKVMEKDNLEILVRFGPQAKPTGILLLGSKKNGSMYTKQDIALLRISAKNIGLSLDNAKKYEQIIHFADTLHLEVKRATSRLRNANAKLKTLDSLKDEFIATASHQLRTPSASVHDALRMLNDPSMTDEDRVELTQMAEASSEHLVTVVRTMLNMARLQAGHFTIDRSETELVALTEKVIDQVKVIASQKGSSIVFDKPAHSLVQQVDVAKINEALSNYIENAIKYSPNNSIISVSLFTSDNTVFFEITDQGMGVPTEERQHLFGKFYRATNARKEQPDGNGIGLYVVKSIAEGHGGHAYYRPADAGGSVFGLSFPMN